MNIPDIYLIEPYNAYAPKGRKKHWHEIVEEQALMARIIAEQQALQEAASKTLPPNSPNIATQTVTGTPQGGAGGIPVIDYFQPMGESIGFTATPRVGPGPLTVVFSNTTTTPQFDTYLWKFGDGTTSALVNPTHVYQSGSAAGYKVELTASHTVTPTLRTSSYAYISASIPAVTANFTYVTSSDLKTTTASFTNTSTNTSQTPTTTYKWNFGDGSAISTEINPVHYYTTTDFVTASLQATGSYGIASSTSSIFNADPIANYIITL